MTSINTNSDPLLSVQEAARYLDMSHDFVRREIARGRLAPTRLGRNVRVRHSELERYICDVTTAVPDRRSSQR